MRFAIKLAFILLAFPIAGVSTADDDRESSRDFPDWGGPERYASRERDQDGDQDRGKGSPGPSDRAKGAHQRIRFYTGPETCIRCHRSEARAMHGSVHYQQGGAFPNLDNVPSFFFAAGERPAHPAGALVATGVNTYCGTHENSPRFTCAGCHVGNGRFPKSPEDFDALNRRDQLAELANIDCLMCHQEAYKRFPDWTSNGYGFLDLVLENVTEDASGVLIRADGESVVRTGYAGIPNVDPVTQDFQFLPAGLDTLPAEVPMAPMGITTLEAARTVHATTRKSCLNCHAGAAGADGAKRGDLYRELANAPAPTMDYHMSPQGADKTCSDCHDAGGHRIRGRGLDLRPNDVPERLTCESCHGERPHGDYSTSNGTRRDTHAAKVACQTCHIPSYAKAAVGTETARDWQDPHPSAAACNGRGGWLPREDKGFNLTPTYTWFDGRSEVHYLGEPLARMPTIALAANVAADFVGGFIAGEPAYVLGAPSAVIAADGSLDYGLGVTNPAAKLYPMKEHWGKLASDGETLIGHSTFEFFRTGSFCRAVAVGLGDDPDSVCIGVPGTDMPPGTAAVAVHTFQTINHGVEPEDNALDCGDCHGSFRSDRPVRMNLRGELGYRVKGNYDSLGAYSDTCTACHSAKPEKEGNYFAFIHDEHVADEGKDCSVCHGFFRPERGLSTRIQKE